MVVFSQSPTLDNGCEFVWELLPRDGASGSSGGGIEVDFSFDYYRDDRQNDTDRQPEGSFKSTFKFGSMNVSTSISNFFPQISQC